MGGTQGVNEEVKGAKEDLGREGAVGEQGGM